jgi:thioesterase domain-containing protein
VTGRFSPESLQRFFEAKVPPAVAMGVRVLESTPQRVRLAFPLSPNLNHHNTAFGGSLSAAGILAGWALLHVRLAAEGIEAATVVAESRTRYLAPVEGDFEAEALAPAEEPWAAFLDALGRWDRSRLAIATTIRPAGGASGPAVVHDGIYVAIRPAQAAR